MSDLLYWFVVCCGAVTLLIEAFRNFNAQADDSPFALHPILRDIEVRNLCTPGEAAAGFFFYASFYLAVYGVVLGSTTIYELIQQADLASSEIGATGALPAPLGEVLGSSSEVYGKPIFISAFLISCLSLGMVKPIERMMRGVAHRFAGIPRGVYAVIEGLRAAKYKEYCVGYPTPLRDTFEHKIRRLFGQDSEILKHERAEIETALYAIDALSPATQPDNQTLYFPIRRLSALTSLSDKLDEEMKQVKKAIDTLDVTEEENDPEQLSTSEKSRRLSELSREVMLLRANTMAVFAVLFVRNNRSVFSVRSKRGAGDAKNWHISKDPIDRIRTYIKSRYNVELNSFALAAVLATIFSALVIYGIYGIWWGDKADDLKDKIIKASFWDVVTPGFMVISSIAFAVISREIRIEQQSWDKNWKLYRLPFLRLCTMAFIPGVIAVVAVTVGDLAEYYTGSGFSLTDSQIANFFRARWEYLLSYFFAGMIVAIGAMAIMDKHDSSWVIFTILIAVTFAVLYFLYLWAVQSLWASQVGGGGERLCSIIGGLKCSTDEGATGFRITQTYRDAMILSAYPCLFLVFFALFLEITEEERWKRLYVWLQRIISPRRARTQKAE